MPDLRGYIAERKRDAHDRVERMRRTVAIVRDIQQRNPRSQVARDSLVQSLANLYSAEAVSEALATVR